MAPEPRPGTEGAEARDAGDYAAWTSGEWDWFERLAGDYELEGRSKDEAEALARQRVAEARAERAKKGEAPPPPDPAYSVRPCSGAPTPSLDDDWRACKARAREGFAQAGTRPTWGLEGATAMELDLLDRRRILEGVYAGRLVAILGNDGRAVVFRRETGGSA